MLVISLTDSADSANLTLKSNLIKLDQYCIKTVLVQYEPSGHFSSNLCIPWRVSPNWCHIHFRAGSNIQSSNSMTITMINIIASWLKGIKMDSAYHKYAIVKLLSKAFRVGGANHFKLTRRDDKTDILAH